jgi:ankyrin repeat protein
MENELFCSCFSGYIDKIKDVLENGGNVNTSDEHGNTLVHIASKNNQYKVLWYLRKKDAKLNTKNKDGDTPLHVACKNHSLFAAKELIKYISNIKVKNLEGKIPFDYLTKSEKEIMENAYDRLNGMGKYEYKPVYKILHWFGPVR